MTNGTWVSTFPITPPTVADPGVGLWLSTFEGRDWPSSGKGRVLWHRSVPMAHLPGPDDEIHVLWSAESQEWFMPVGFKRRYWNGDGRVHLEHRSIIVNPDEEGERQISDQFKGGFRDYRWQAWRDADEGREIWGPLTAAGWVRYGED